MMAGTPATRQASCESKLSQQTESTNVGPASRQVSPYSNESNGTAASPSANRADKKVRRNLCNSLGAEAGLDLHYDWESDDDASGSIASNDCFSRFRRPASDVSKKINKRINTHTLAAEAGLDLHIDWEDDDAPSNTSAPATAPRPKYGSVGGFEFEISENLIFA
mmetsp:Transcript_60962/g.96758  ORF Transcript_60962/g.96758 Transcript_60962/m.96758 type:complete len:165 (-) Transcript_60962:405-899(-)